MRTGRAQIFKSYGYKIQLYEQGWTINELLAGNARL